MYIWMGSAAKLEEEKYLNTIKNIHEKILNT